MKKTYGYIPLWFLLIVPPLLIFTFIFNFIQCGLAILCGAILLKIKDPFNNYYKRIMTAFILAIEADIICILFYALPELLYKIDFLNKNLITPLEYNPYKNIFSFIYIFILFIVLIKFIFKRTNKRVLKGFEENDDKLRANILITTLLIPYLFFIPSTLLLKPNKSNLEDFRGTISTDRKSTIQILNNLNVSKYISSYTLDTSKEPYTLNIYLNKFTKDRRKKLEIDAATIYLLIRDINEIVYYMDDTTYTYDINRINDIFSNIKRCTLSDIKDRYSTKPFMEYTYFGRIDDYDVFDIGKGEIKEQLIYNDMGIHYYLEGTDYNKIFLYKGEHRYKTLKEALETNEIDIETLQDSELEIIITGVEEDEDINK